MKQKILITSLAKVKKETPWRVGIILDNNFTFFNVGEKGNVAMSPRFNVFLEEIEKKTSRFPVDITFHHLQDNREMEAVMVRNQIVYVDCGFNLQRIIPTARFYYQKEVMGNPLEVKYNQPSTPTFRAFEDVSENIAKTAQDYIAIARVEKVTDGDTIDVTILKTAGRLGGLYLKEGETIPIRFNGVDTPETYDIDQTAYKDPKNREFAKTYGVTLDDMYTMGDEAKKLTKKLLGFNESNKPLVILNFDRETDSDPPLQETYDRYMADVYATSEVNADILMGKVEKGNSFVHVNKTLLTTKSETFEHVPLGQYAFTYAVGSTTILNPMDWAAELDLQIFDPGKQVKDVLDEIDLDADTLPEETVIYEDLNTDTINFDTTIGPSQNNLDFFEPYDDRLSEFTKGIKTPEDLVGQDKVRIGDVILTIPPVSINVSKTNTLHKVKTMRTKSSVIVNNGHTITSIVLELYFHDLESINGKKYPWKKEYAEGEEKKYFYVDGLRPLLAQFANTPFVPIDNYYINDTLGIHDVALMNLEVTTVPNFPESIVATLTLAEFNSEAFLMSYPTLRDAINYPMMRWYYNRSLAERGPKYRYFQGIDGPISSDITFTLADEEVMLARKNALQFIKSADSPEKYKVDVKKNSSYKALEEDRKVIGKILEQYETYDKAKLKEYAIVDNPPPFTAGGIEDELMKAYGIKRETAENAVTEGGEIFVDMYGEDFSSESFIGKNENIFIPYESKMYYTTRFDYNFITGFSLAGYDEDPPVDYEDEAYKGKEKKGLFIIKKLTDNDNQAKLEKKYKKYWHKKKKLFMIPGEKELITLLEEIRDGSKEVDAMIDEYEKEFNSVLKIIESSEYGIPMKEFPISGTLIPISMNVGYTNEFSMNHIQKGTAPTLQYMGGGDPYVDLVLEVDEEAAKDLNELIAKSDQYAKEYNIGITNGYLGIQNDLIKLFGISYVMFESISINTISGYPDRFQVSMKGLAFNKTQRQSEELTAIPGNHKHMDRDMLEQNKYAFANDRMIDSRLHEVEVYPDLELPTYKELNAVLPELDAGNIEEYTNLTGAKYLDPDFYFSTNITVRQMVEEQFQGNHQFNMFDGTGIAAYTSNADGENLVNMSDADKEKIKSLEKEVEPLGWEFKWGDGDSAKESGENTSAGTSVSDKAGEMTHLNKEILDFLTKETDEGKLAYEQFPTKEEWTKLFGTKYSYDIFKHKPSPDEAVVYQQLDSLVDEYFKDYYSSPKFIQECRGDLKDADKSKKALSYVLPEEMYAIMYHTLFTAEGVKESRLVNKLEKAEDLTEPKMPDTISVRQVTKAEMKVTKERFMTLLKAFLDKTSGWKHYRGKVPMVSKEGRIGIAQVDVSSKDMSLDETKKLMYNWKYNLEYAIKKLAKYYKEYKKIDEDYKNFELACRPWDAMFLKYDDPESKTKRNKKMLENSFVSGVLNRFNHYAFKPFNTPSGFNQDVYKGYAGLSWDDFVAIGNGNETDYVNALLDLEYYKKSVLKKADLTIDSKKSSIKKVMKTYLETLGVEEIYEIYQKHLKSLYEMHKDDDSNWQTGMDIIDGEKDKNGYWYSTAIIEKGAKIYKEIKGLENTAEKSTEATDTRLYNDVDPHTIYTEMFHDMRHYDQRGRMARAFPGFQLFIIHEGQYFGRFKFWDNMYGFNAIESIDVYRSRKIAADTAVIRMSNVYSNLTTRRTDVDYVDRELKWWDNYIWNEIPQDLIDKKENETHKNLNLETGARIHLRMGYGGNAAAMPVVFNGTITEIGTGPVIDIVAQGDGIELGNTISGDPGDENDGIFMVQEPRDLICSLMSSKGSWLKDYFNGISSGRVFEDNPLGIMHFGQPFNTSDSSASKPLGNLIWKNDEYGEIAQNIYSSNGSPTFSQWLHPNGEKNNFFSDLTWSNLWENKFKIFNPGDEKNVVVKFYNQTVWDIIQTVAYTSPDYIAAVHPFELRSTLFFGKPYWRASFQYDSRYEFDAANKTWARHLVREARRPYMQHKMYTSDFDIIQNNIKASEDTLYTNVIVNYDGKQTPVLYADADIRYDKQKTRVVEANIVAKLNDKYTSEVMATYYGNSALRDNMKDMYKGNLLVLGDPSAKPHDMLFLGDEINDMQGNALIKSVTHHFSLETGFVTSIEPDLLVVNDDIVLLEISKWYYSFGQSILATMLIRAAGNKAARRLVSWMTKPGGVPAKVTKWSSARSLKLSLKIADDGSKEMQAVFKTLDEMIKGKDVDMVAMSGKLADQLDEAYWTFKLKPIEGKAAAIKNSSKKAVLKASSVFVKAIAQTDDAGKIGKGIAGVVRGIGSFTPIGFIVNAAIWIGTEMIFENYRRYRENLQCVIAIPLTYRGQELTAGINNHAGMIYGEAPGRMDRLTGATFGQDDGGDVEKTFGSFVFELANLFTGTPGTYAVADKAAELNKLSGNTSVTEGE